MIAPRIVSTAISVVLVLTLRTYWALAIGIIGMYGARVLFSYIAHPYRPRWDMSKFKKLFGFSSAFLLRGVSYYAVNNLHIFTISIFATTAIVGAFGAAQSIALMLVGEISMSVTSATFPGIAQIKHDAQRLRQGVIKSLQGVLIIAAPTGIGLAAIAVPATTILLGNNPEWGVASSYLTLSMIIKVGILQMSDLLSIFVRPLIAATCMGLCLQILPTENMNIYISSVIQIAVGGVIYSTMIYMLWAVVGKPDGAEKTLVNLVASRLKFLQKT